MSRRKRYSDTFSGEADKEIRSILSESDGSSDEFIRKLKRVMLNVINNELTSRQKEIIVLYYFKETDIVRIGEMLGISPQAVSAAMKRARLKIYQFMKYYIK